MSAPKHTAGPWHADGYYVFPAWQAAAAVARVQPGAKAFADARLIAAAPDLLEALTGERDWLDAVLNITSDPTVRAGAKRRLTKVRAAIAKATGEAA